MANILLSLLATAAKPLTAKFIAQTRSADAVQARFLQSLLRYQQNTELGQDLKLTEISTFREFQQRVPIWPYTNYEPYIERAAQGKPNILNPDPVTYLNLSSGSTGKQKLIPVTRQTQRLRSQANILSIGFGLIALQQQRLPFGQMILTSSTQGLGKTAGNIPYGPISAGDLRSQSPISLKLLAHPFELLSIPDSQARNYLCLLFALHNPYTAMIAATFPVLALQLGQFLEAHAKSLIADIAQGTIAPGLSLSPQLKTQFLARLSPNPQRAEQLQSILQKEGRLTPKQAWPHLACVITARGGTSDFYFQRFTDYFGDVPIFGGLYASCEAVFGIYHTLNQDGSILAINSSFFEFFPVDAETAAPTKTLLAEQLQVGGFYRVLITNYHGFYRYDIGDVIEVVGFYGKTPLIVFRHRSGGSLSSITEKTTEYHIIQVMQSLRQSFNLALENFCVTLSAHETPPHYWVNLELAPHQILSNPQAFLVAFDRELKAIHTSYAIKRPDLIPSPKLRIMAPGSFTTIRQRLLDRGTPEAHLKFPHISENRQFLEGLTVEQEVNFPE
jgi:GH3 auxin-responsive promoter